MDSFKQHNPTTQNLKYSNFPVSANLDLAVVIN